MFSSFATLTDKSRVLMQGRCSARHKDCVMRAIAENRGAEARSQKLKLNYCPARKGEIKSRPVDFLGSAFSSRYDNSSEPSAVGEAWARAVASERKERPMSVFSCKATGT